MEIIPASKIRKLTSEFAVLSDFPMSDMSLSGAIAEIKGRYPEKGFALNKKSKELAYVLNGAGKIVSARQSLLFSKGDVIFVDKNEKYYWEGIFTIFMANSPSFDPNQHIISKK